MSGTRRSFRDAVRRRQQAEFVGRMAELAQFRTNLGLSVDDPDRRFIFGVHGDGGVGKSFLLRQWGSIAQEAGAVMCWVDEPVFGAPEAMRAMAIDLARQGTNTDGFLKLLDGYQQRRFEAEADPDAPSGLASFMTQTAVRMGLHAAHAVPGVGGLADSVNADTLAAQTDQLRVFLGKKFRRHEDVRLLLSPLDVLTPALVHDLAQAGRRGVLTLFFDTYEQTGPVLDGWLRSVLDGTYGDLPEELVVTIAGRSPLDTGGWAPYLGVMAEVPLEPFTDTEARQFLVERGIKDDRVIQVILSVSGRLPLLLATLAENQPTDPDLVGDPSGDAVERFLKWEPNPVRRTLAIAAALPRIVNEDVLAVLLPPDDGEEPGRLFAWLRSLPFITDNAGRCQYHDVVRTAMIRLERRQSPVRWKERHRTLAAAYSGWRLDHCPQDAWEDPAWRSLRLEETYHLLCADPGIALDGALGEVVRACASQPAAAAQWAQAITGAGHDADADLPRAVGQRLEEALRLNPEEAMVACLGVVLSEGRLPTDLLALALHARGRALYYLDREEEALTDLNKAIALVPDDSAFLADRGETYRWLGRHEEAFADFDRAIELDPDNAGAIASRGDTYEQMGRYQEALADFDRAIELNPDYSWAIASRGETYQQMGRYHEALADFDRAIELNPDYSWAIAHRGETYQQMGRYHEALADFDRAIELNPDGQWAIASRGETYQQMGRYQEALADFDRAIELNPDGQWAIASRGGTYQQMGRYQEALADFDRAVELDPDHPWTIASRGGTYQQMGRYQEALADLDRAIELDPADDWSHYLRSLVYLSCGEISRATSDLETAIDFAKAKIQSAGKSSNDAYNLGVYLTAKGNIEQAREQLASALRSYPNPLWALDAVSDLRELKKVQGMDTAGINALIKLLEGA